MSYVSEVDGELYEAACSGEWEKCEELLLANPAINPTGYVNHDFNRTALFIAVEKGIGATNDRTRARSGHPKRDVFGKLEFCLN